MKEGVAGTMSCLQLYFGIIVSVHNTQQGCHLIVAFLYY